MAPPKRKTTGRVTPKGTKPGQITAMAKEAHHHESAVAASSRYTPPAAKELYDSPKWVPIFMFACIALGVLCILARYVIPSFQNTNTPVLIGLVFMLVGLFTATKWR